jgi:phosphopantothenoylcysteine decarboxylase / phosphopantothenate---cysteine ligase
MAEPEELVAFLGQYFAAQTFKPLKGLKALVTAGPTYERIDPVRFIGNFSSGKMGVAVAEALAAKGALVTLVLGPSHLQSFQPGVTTIRVESAAEMFDACMNAFPEAAISVLAAAVADYRPEELADRKIKKAEGSLQLSLTRTHDILASLGSMKTEEQILVGFALETNDEHANALKKLKGKNADLIVMNSLNDEGAGFGHDTNKVTLLQKNGDHVTLPLQTKKEAAEAIVNHILELRHVEEAI